MAHLLPIKGRSLRYSPGWGNSQHCLVALYVGEGSEREQCLLLSPQPASCHFPHYPQAIWALPVLIPRWVVLCTVQDPVRLSVSPTAATPIGFDNRRFCGFFPLSLESWIARSILLPSCSSQFIHTQIGDCLVCQLSPCLPGPPATALPHILSTLAACLCSSYQCG